jgi:Domain of Unknown Function (DUF928)
MNTLFKKIGFSLVIVGAFSAFTYSLPSGVRIVSAIAAGVFKVKLPPPPPNRGIAGNRVGGASRVVSRSNSLDESTELGSPLTALVPEYKNSSEASKYKPELTKVWGLTASEHPTIWFYIPYDLDSISRIDFSLSDGDNLLNRTVFRNAIKRPTQPGIVSFSLPKTSMPLAIDRLYRWELKLSMKRQLDKEISVKGWIQRASLNRDLIDQINHSPLDRQAALYAENGFWYDALSSLAQLQHSRSSDLAPIQDWQNILKSIDLGKLANKPFIKR